MVVYHFAIGVAAAAPAWLRHLQQAGHAAVSLFFVLSGFVLAYNYAAPLGDGTVSRRRFWWARLARVYPLYAAAVVAELGLELHARRPPGGAAVTALAHLVGLQAWLPRVTFAGNTPGWSVSVELAFYALFPFLAARLFVSPRGWWRAMALTWALALAAAALPWALGLDGDAALFLKCGPPLRVPEFVLGVGLGRRFLVRPASLGRARAGRLALAAIAATVAVAELAAAAALPRHLLHALLLPGFALLLWAVAHGGLAAALANPAARALGEASYALYLLQIPLFEAVGGRYDWGAGRLGAFVGLLVLVALAAHRWVERPAQRALLGRAERWRVEAWRWARRDWRCAGSKCRTRAR